MNLKSLQTLFRNPLALSAGTALLTTLAVSGPVFAQTATGSLTVQATVVGRCRIDAATLSFGNYDPTSLTALTQSTPLNVYCTRGVDPTSIDLGNGGNGNRSMTGPDTLSPLAYGLFQDSTYSTPWTTGAAGVNPDSSTTPTTPLTAGGAIQIYGRITAGQNVPVGTYTDTVTITVNY